MSTPRTIIDKLWEPHVVASRPGGVDLLFIDRHFLHEGSFHAFHDVASRGGCVAEPGLTFGVADHYVPVRGNTPSPEIARMVADLKRNCEANGIVLFGADDPRQGIVHVIGPEQGLTLPGLTIEIGRAHV